MKEEYFTEDGFYWNNEEVTQFARFKIKELIDLHYFDDEIIEYIDNDTWKKVAKKLIKELKRNKLKQND